MEIFAVKRNIISDISKELLNYIFEKLNRSSQIKNIADRLDLGELGVDDIAADFTAESSK